MTPPVYANWCTRRFINVQSMVSRNGCPRKFWRLHLSIFGQQPRCQKQRTTPDEPSDSLQFISLHSPIWSRYNDSEALQNAALYRTKSNVAFKTHKSFRQRYLLAACLLRCLLALITLSHVIANASRHCATVFLILFIFTMPFPLQAAKKL